VTLDRDVPLLGNLRFVLRGSGLPDFGAVVGGGRILDASPPRRRRAAVRGSLRESDDPVAVLLAEAGPQGVLTAELAPRLGILPLQGATRCYAPGLLEAAEARVLARVRAFHEAHPGEPGVRDAELDKDSLGVRALRGLLERKELIREGALVRLASFDVGNLAKRLETVQRLLIATIERAGVHGPTERELLELHGQDAAEQDMRRELRRLEGSGKVVRCQGLYFSSCVLARLSRDAARAALAQRTLPVSWLKDHEQLTRKHAIPLWTWLDHSGATSRRGNVRVAGPLARKLADQA
jgi:hypothetical protein